MNHKHNRRKINKLAICSWKERTYCELLFIIVINIYLPVSDVSIPSTICYLNKQSMKCIWAKDALSKVDIGANNINIWAQNSFNLHWVCNESEAIWKISYSQSLKTTDSSMATRYILTLRSFTPAFCSLTWWSQCHNIWHRNQCASEDDPTITKRERNVNDDKVTICVCSSRF